MTQAPTPGPLSVGDYAARLEDHPLVKAGEVHRVTEVFRGGYLGFARPVGGEWNPKGWGKCDADGWMPWSGGENPVPGREVTIHMRGELIPTEVNDNNTGLSDSVDWDHEGGKGDIIAFRLAPTAPVEASGSEREHGPKCWGMTSLSDEVAHCYCPQPSGETGGVYERLSRAFKANIYDHPHKSLSAEAEHTIDLFASVAAEALSTTPARAEAQDEGAAGEREQAIKELIAGYAVMHEVICFMAGTSGAAGRWYYEKANAAFEKVKPLHVFGNDLATHPSPTPAADADRVLLEQWVEAFDGLGSGSGPLINATRARLAALKSTAAKEGG